MYKEQVDVPALFARIDLLNTLGQPIRDSVRVTQLSGEENLLPRYGTSGHCLAHFRFVAVAFLSKRLIYPGEFSLQVPLRGVNMPVPRLNRRADCAGGDLGRGEVDTKAELRDLELISIP